jgi:hypothetical protein
MKTHAIATSVVLFVMALLPSTSVADDQKGKQPAKDQRQESPEDTVTDFARHLRAREISKAKQLLFMPINDPDVAGRLDDMLQVAAKSPPPKNRIHVFDSHTIKQMGVVVSGTESPRYIDGIDIDPIFLRKKGGKWRIVFAITPDQLRDHELTDDDLRQRADELLEWYEKREQEVRTEWRKRKAKSLTPE